MIVAESKVYLSRQVKRNLAKAIDFIQYIEIGRDTSGLPPLHIIEESYLQTFSHSLLKIVVLPEPFSPAKRVICIELNISF